MPRNTLLFYFNTLFLSIFSGDNNEFATGVLQENPEADDIPERICSICSNEPCDVLFMPCCHIVTCSRCAPRETTCSSCQEQVASTIKVCS